MDMSKYRIAKLNIVAMHEIARQLESLGLILSAIDIRAMADSIEKEIEEQFKPQPHDLINKT